MRISQLLRGALLCALLAPFGGSAARADEPASWGYELPNELMSPWCPGFSLADCGSGYAGQLRAWILEQEKQGRSRDEVEAELLGRYGEGIRQAPKLEGRALFAYVIPGAALLAGAVLVAVFFTRQSRRASRIENPPVNRAVLDGALDARLGSRVDAELAAFDDAAHSD